MVDSLPPKGDRPRVSLDMSKPEPMVRSSSISGSRLARTLGSGSSLRRSLSARSTMTNGSIHLLDGETIMFPLHLGHETKAELDQRQRWEYLFDPHHSFGSFQQGSHYRGRRSIQMRRDDGQDDEVSHDSALQLDDHDVDEPTLPSLASLDAPPQPQPPSVGPEPLQTSATTTIPPCDKVLLKRRLELLTLIRGQEAEDFRDSVEKHHHLHKSKTNDDDSLFDEKMLDLEKGNVNGHHPHPYHSRDDYVSPSLVLFLVGFLFPPLWIVGAIYSPPYAHLRTSSELRADALWRRRSRIAFGVFSFLLLIILVTILFLKPGLLGWRQTKNDKVQLHTYAPT